MNIVWLRSRGFLISGLTVTFSCFQKPDVLTTGAGNPIGDKLNALTVGPRGPLLVQDVVFTDEMAHFDRERIPERVVHAKGAGMFKIIYFLCVELRSF